MKKSETVFCTLVLAVCLASFYFITADSVFTVHDDILTYMQVLRGNLLQTAADDAMHGRIGHIPLTLLLYIPYFFRSVQAIRIFSLLSVMFDMTALFCLVRRVSGPHAAWLTSVLFISFACISNQHNLFVSYTLGHQIPSGLVLFALNEFIKYYSSGKKQNLIVSAVLLVSASALYEACTAYIIMFVFAAVYMNRKKSSLSPVKTITDIRWHIILTAVFTGIYAVWRIFYPSDYDGSVLYFGNIPRSLNTLVRYSAGMIPGLPASAMYIKKYITAEQFTGSLKIWMAASPLLASAAFYILFPKIRSDFRRIPALLFCLCGILVPNIIISFTPKYTEWTAGNSYSYVTSFYSYFFIIPAAVIILKFIIRKNSKTALVAASCLVFTVSLVCTLGNAAWNCFFSSNLQRYRAFENAVSSDYFESLEDGTTVYIPDYQGIHGNMDTTKDFASVFSSSDIYFCTSESEIDFSRPAVILKYDNVSGTVTFGTLSEDLTYTAEIILG